MQTVPASLTVTRDNINPSAKDMNVGISTTRILSVDAYRGFVMLLMMGEVLSLSAVAKNLPGNKFWQFLSFHQSHVDWIWLSLHDMIQPSFSFLVGVVVLFSIDSRTRRGSTTGALIRHTIVRSIILICLGIFLRSMHSTQTYFTFEDTLSQIGLGYTFLVLLTFFSQRVQIIFLIILLTGYWAAFAFYPLPGGGFDYSSAGVAADWPYNLHGFAAHWNKNTNLAWAFDRWFLNLFPRENKFRNNSGGYATLSFIPTLGTMILGLFAGNLLKSGKTGREKVKLLLMVGICFLFLAFFYEVIDVAHKTKWSFLFLVVGANSIVAYVLADGFSSFIIQSLYIHLGAQYDLVWGPAYATLVKGAIVLCLEWLILYWMYRKKVFIKI